MRKEIIAVGMIAMTLLPLFIVTVKAPEPLARLPSDEHYVNPKCMPHYFPGCNGPGNMIGNSVADEVLVRFKPEARKDGMVVSNIAAAAHAKEGATVIEEFKGVPGLQLVKLPEGVAVPDAVKLYQQNPNVLYAEPNYLRYKSAIPNDPYFSQLWGLHNTGQKVNGVTGTPGADINAPAAWDITTGSNDVIVAVLDTGVDYNVPDLHDNIVNGWDFATHSNDPMDRDGHGTKVAGVIAAVGNNSIGVTGVMWKAKIMPLRVLGSNGGTVSDEIEAIHYADKHGAHVINMSYGNYRTSSQAEKDAIDASPAIFVCSAGNGGNNNDQNPFYPASYPSDNIISVAATDQNDALTSNSNYGPISVQVAAPGKNVNSTWLPLELAWLRLFRNFTEWDVQAPWSITNNNNVSFAMVSSPGSSIINSSITLKNPLDLTGKFGAYLGYYVWLNTSKKDDYFYVQVSSDGTHWDYIDGWWGHSNGFILHGVSISNYDNYPYLKIRFGLKTDGEADPSSVFLDLVAIMAFDPSSHKESYWMSSGTSYAAAYVSGLAGLVKATNPSLTNLQIKDTILKNVDVKSSLSGKISTGGRINAGKTLSCIASPHAPPLSVTSAQLVHNHAQYFKGGITTARTANARVAPYSIPYKQTATVP